MERSEKKETPAMEARSHSPAFLRKAERKSKAMRKKTGRKGGR